MKFIKRMAWSLFRIVVAVCFGMTLLLAGLAQIEKEQQNQLDRVQDIYHKLVIATGRASEVPPLYVVESDEANAYTDGSSVVILTGMLKITKNDDEIATILGHEIGHVLLEHTGKLSTNNPREQVVLESMADKIGAYYMMRAGYDICKGREIWRTFLEKYGDSLGGDHPDDAYRYEQLNVQCGAH